MRSIETLSWNIHVKDNKYAIEWRSRGTTTTYSSSYMEWKKLQTAYLRDVRAFHMACVDSFRRKILEEAQGYLPLKDKDMPERQAMILQRAARLYAILPELLKEVESLRCHMQLHMYYISDERHQRHCLERIELLHEKILNAEGLNE